MGRHCTRQARSQALFCAMQPASQSARMQYWKLAPHWVVQPRQHGSESITDAKRRDTVRKDPSTLPNDEFARPGG